jgi:DNA-binding CsgD family transcriptional regulator
MDCAKVLAALDELTPKQKKVLREILAGKTSGEIATAWFVHPSTISKHLTAISRHYGLVNQPGEYYSFRWDLIDLFVRCKPEWVDLSLVGKRAIDLDEPEGMVPLESRFYIKRPPFEQRCFDAVMKPAALIRIKGPRQVGKTSLITRILAYAADQGAETVSWDLAEPEESILENLESFLKSLCEVVTQQLGLENRVSEHWASGLSSKNMTCSAYFEEYLLPQIEGTLVLGIDDLHRMFPYGNTAPDALTLFRSWHEKGKRKKIWGKLRLILAHSTEEYAQMDVNQSPFNVGVPITLPEFTVEQARELANRHSLTWSDTAVREKGLGLAKLHALVGGHPYLIRLAMHQMVQEQLPLEQLLKEACTEVGVFNRHLDRYWEQFHHDTELSGAMKQVVMASEPVRLNPGLKFKLHSMGVIELQEHGVSPRCQLYRTYFQQVL